MEQQGDSSSDGFEWDGSGTMNFYSNKGFTLIELLVSMVISMILLAGLYTNFIMQSRVQNAQAGRSESSEDIQIVSQIMRREIRMAQAAGFVCAGSVVTYVDVDGFTGSFEYQKTGHRSDEICWDRPNDATGCQEMARNLDSVNGMQLSFAGGVCQVTLLGSYEDHTHTVKTWTTVFKVAPRN